MDRIKGIAVAIKEKLVSAFTFLKEKVVRLKERLLGKAVPMWKWAVIHSILAFIVVGAGVMIFDRVRGKAKMNELRTEIANKMEAAAAKVRNNVSRNDPPVKCPPNVQTELNKVANIADKAKQSAQNMNTSTSSPEEAKKQMENVETAKAIQSTFTKGLDEIEKAVKDSRGAWDAGDHKKFNEASLRLARASGEPEHEMIKTYDDLKKYMES